MNIGFDAKRAFTNTTGLGNYSRDLIDLITQKGVRPFLFSPKAKPAVAWTPPAQSKVITPSRRTFLWRTYKLYRQARAHPLELYHGLSHELPLSIKKFRCPALVTMHDLIYKRFPHYFGWWDRNIYDLKWRWSVHAADHIVAISKSTADDLIRFFKVDPKKISVIYNCVSADFQAKEPSGTQLPDGIPSGPFVLFLGQHNERKNLDLILRAYEKAAKKLPPLVVLGAKEPLRQLQTLPSGKIIQPQNNYTGPELATIVRRARMLVYPSRFEGFGLPILEAMQSGTPVISCSNSSLPEVGGQAIQYTSEEDPDELIGNIRRIAKEDHLYRDLPRAGLARAARFSRERHQAEMMALYGKIIP
ncbi:MAG: glycosyltransferase [Bacteroidetes bacterium]|jgi:glycosyltransferase involved in cell wall biosynthesis|nr:glycosyltransferase [Bacteroidota bacterium]